MSTRRRSPKSSLDKSILEFSSAPNDRRISIQGRRNLVKASCRSSLNDSMMNSHDSKKGKEFYGKSVIPINYDALENYSRQNARNMDRFLTSLTEKYRSMAHDMSIRAKEGKDIGPEKLINDFLDEINNTVRPIIYDQENILNDFRKIVEETSSFYGDPSFISKELKERMKTLDLEDAVNDLFRTNISSMGIMTKGDITGLMLDSLWPLLENIQDQHRPFIEMMKLNYDISGGIGNFLTYRGQERMRLAIERQIEKTRFGIPKQLESYTSVGDQHVAWLSKVLSYLHEEISLKQLHCVLPRMRYTTVMGSDASYASEYIRKVLNTRSSLGTQKKQYYQPKRTRILKSGRQKIIPESIPTNQRFSASAPSNVSSPQADQWLRPSYVRVKIPIPTHDSHGDIKPGVRPKKYKYVWGIRIVIGSPAKEPAGGDAFTKIGERGHKQGLVRHMDTFRSDLLINLFIKSVRRVSLSDKPWESDSGEFNLLQLVYKPPNEAKAYRLMSCLTILTASIDIIRKDILTNEWIKSGIRNPLDIKSAPQYITYKVTMFTYLIKYMLVISLRNILSKSEIEGNILKLNNLLAVYLRNTLKGYIESNILSITDRLTDEAQEIVENYELDETIDIGDSKTRNTSILSTAIGVVRFITACKDVMYSQITFSDTEFESYGVTDRSRMQNIRYFLKRSITISFSGLIDHYAKEISIRIHEIAISTPKKQAQVVDRTAYVPENRSEISEDLSYGLEKTTLEQSRSINELEAFFHTYYTRDFSLDVKISGNPHTKDLRFPLSGDINTTGNDYVLFRRIPPSDPPPVVIVLFDSGAPDASTVQDLIYSDDNFYDSISMSRNVEGFRGHPMKYWTTATEDSKENIPMSYDVEYDVDGYIHTDLLKNEEDYFYDFDDMKRSVSELDPDNASKMDSAIQFLENSENRGIYLPSRTYSQKPATAKSMKNPYFTKGSDRKRSIMTKEATISFCDIRSLIGRSSLSGILHANTETAFRFSPELLGMFQHLQWPGTQIFDPTSETSFEGLKDKLHVEVIAKYDNEVRWSGNRLSPEEFTKENWNRTESWGLAKASRRAVDIPYPPTFDEKLLKSPYWRKADFNKSFPVIFRYLDEIDVYRWRRASEVSKVGVNSFIKTIFEKASKALSPEVSQSGKTSFEDINVFIEVMKFSYCSPRFLPREIEEITSDEPGFPSSEELWRHAINSVNTSDPNNLDMSQFITPHLQYETQEALRNFYYSQEGQRVPMSPSHFNPMVENPDVEETTKDIPREPETLSLAAFEAKTDKENIENPFSFLGTPVPSVENSSGNTSITNLLSGRGL